MTPSAPLLDTLRHAGLLAHAPAELPAVRGLTDDSRRVQPGTMFCAVPGTTHDGHDYVDEAMRRGAVVVVVSRPRELPIPTIVVTDSRRAVARLAAAWHGYPAHGMTLVGVTGTNGKSTTVALTRHLLNAGGTVGAIGTLGVVDGAGAPVGTDLELTTPGPVQLHATLAALKTRGVTSAVMEASSHALHQHRLDGLVFRAAVYTNLTHDHLDYHADLQSYLAAKLALLEQLAPDGWVIVNADDHAWDALPEVAGRRKVLYGRSDAAGVRADAVSLGEQGSTLTLKLGDQRLPARIPLLGEFNVSNALAAAATAWMLDVPPGEIVSRLATAPQVTGRMERLAVDGFVVLRDYAHTPDALERAITTLRPITRGRLVVLFGCGGDRDRRKRPVMGRIAARQADLAIVTSDNPRTEDPDRIIDEIEAGMDGVAHLRITDRREAIARGVALLQEGDCLLLAGKGHETYQVVGTTRVPMDERAIVSDALAARTAA